MNCSVIMTHCIRSRVVINVKRSKIKLGNGTVFPKSTLSHPLLYTVSHTASYTCSNEWLDRKSEGSRKRGQEETHSFRATRNEGAKIIQKSSKLSQRPKDSKNE